MFDQRIELQNQQFIYFFNLKINLAFNQIYFSINNINMFKLIKLSNPPIIIDFAVSHLGFLDNFFFLSLGFVGFRIELVIVH